MENQIELVHAYIREHPELYLEDTYVDNGVSGTSFARPDWNRLIDDVRRGRIGCIVVKDLSRFGRNYVEGGHYIEEIFPRLGVRFIAITDDFDSARQDDRDALMVPIKNIVNHAYAEDISRKIHATMERKKRGGEVFGSIAYGYLRGEGPSELRPDPETAPVVRMLFRWVLAGVDEFDIAKRLNLMGVPSPAAVRGGRAAEQRREKEARRTLWSATPIRNMLQNPVYCGDLVTGKRVVTMKRTVQMEEADWIRFSDHHEALVGRAEFEAVQSLLEARAGRRERTREENRKAREEQPYDLRGLLFCASCSRQLALQRQGKNAREKAYFCPAHTGYRASQRNAEQFSRRPYISAERLRQTVTGECRAYVVWIRAHRSAVDRADRPGGVLAARDDQVREARSRLTQAEEMADRVYADYVAGILDMEGCLALRAHYLGERDTWVKMLSDATAEQRRYRGMWNRARDFCAQAVALDFDGFDEAAIRAVVERVELMPEGTLRLSFRLRSDLIELVGEWDGPWTEQ